MVPFSILDLCPVAEGATAADALANSLDLARQAEAWGYHRFWLAEHHNMPGIASAATSVLIGHVAGGTEAEPLIERDGGGHGRLEVHGQTRRAALAVAHQRTRRPAPAGGRDGADLLKVPVPACRAGTLAGGLDPLQGEGVAAVLQLQGADPITRMLGLLACSDPWPSPSRRRP